MIHYEEHNPAGEPAVLLLHGLGSAGADWLLQFKPLAEAGYRVLAPDLRGFGQSSWPGRTSVPDMARDVALLLDEIDAGAVHVAGISMGGTVALQLALDHAPRVRRLALVNTFARLRPQGISGYVYFPLRMLLMHTLGMETQARLVTRRIFPRPDQAVYRLQFYQRVVNTDPSAYRAAMWALVRLNVEHRLGEIRVPTLVVTGEDDTTVPPAAQHRLVEGISGARQAVIPKAGHAVIADSPIEFNRVVLPFLEE
ncbi:MAG: 2-hydroxy-6-oxo-6-phenylhexa-2,4-dienoate hydrolase [Anaerolineales bacterium]|nr:2-hydroxy-6-oxo-6-phenylhexa-2,4-dienoate hydrolase [Anaerolineales bacterium]